MSHALTDAERERLATLAALMVPGGKGMPSARDIDLANDPAEEVLRIDPTRLAGAKRFLALDGTVETLADVEALAQKDPDGFADLGVVVANAYFMDPKVRQAIGYPGQEARDASIGLTDEDRALLQPVIDRGAIHR
jgi:hypothetical protein